LTRQIAVQFDRLGNTSPLGRPCTDEIVIAGPFYSELRARAGRECDRQTSPTISVDELWVMRGQVRGILCAMGRGESAATPAAGLYTQHCRSRDARSGAGSKGSRWPDDVSRFSHQHASKEAIHRAGPISKEFDGSPTHCNLFRIEEILDHRDKERQERVLLREERPRLEREVVSDQVFWQKPDLAAESVFSCVANIRHTRMFHFVSLLPLKAVNRMRP
jgi:hypothetical protein